MDAAPSPPPPPARRPLYSPTRDPDADRAVLVAISAMPAFADASFEELRYQQQLSGGLSLDGLSLSSDAGFRPTVARDYHDFCRLLHSVTAQDAVAHLSFEELRLLHTTDEAAGYEARPAETATATAAASTRGSAALVGTSDPRAPSYQPTLIETEPETETRWAFLASISAMPAFADKSLEELRLEDRNAPVGWRRVMSSYLMSPVMSLMELRVRAAVRRVMEDTPRWWECCRERAGAEQRIRPLTTGWCARVLQETTDAWYPAPENARFREFMVARVREARANYSEWEAVPVSLDWRNPFEFAPGLMASADPDENLLLEMDPFAMVGFYCAQSRIVNTVDVSADVVDWASVREIVLASVGEVAARLVSRLGSVVDATNGDDATSQVLWEVLDVEETRPDVLDSLRVQARRVREYITVCENFAIDMLQLRSQEACNRHHDTPHSFIESVVDAVFVGGTTSASLSLSRAVRNEIELLHGKLDGTDDWLCTKSNQTLHIVDPSLAGITARVTRFVPSLTSRRRGDPIDPYVRMSEIAFQNAIPIATTSTISWLPSEVVIHADGRASFASYIHNLHPKSCRDLYHALEKVLTHMIPAFESAVWSLNRGYILTPWFDQTALQRREYVRDCLAPRPTPAVDLPPASRKHPTLWSLKGSNVQVVVRIEEIVVSASGPCFSPPDRSEFGLAPHDIAAVGLYCYGSANIATASLAFTCNVNSDPFGDGHLPREKKSMEAFYGVHTPLVSRVGAGSVTIRDGASVVWPDTYHVRLENIKWADLTGNCEPGSLKLVWFYLVAPGDPVLSTADVAPHQSAWSTTSSEDIARRFLLPDSVLELILAFSSPHSA